MVALRRSLHAEAPVRELRLVDELSLEAARVPRRDALPEHTSYADTGCDLHSSCLNCPLARCRYEEDGEPRHARAAGRDREVLALQRGGGLTVEAIAKRAGISRRTVFRILARARNEGEKRHDESDTAAR